MKYLAPIFSMFCLVAGASFADGHASGDPEAGENEFKKCKSCHSITMADGTDIVKGGKTGPNLYGVVGRVAASVEGFRYGDSIVALGETGFAWNEEDFVTYLADPTEFLREKLDDKKARSKMTFKLRKEEDAKDIYAYLASLAE